MNTKKIDFACNATTREAGLYALKYGWAFARGACRDINRFAHRLPWVLVGIILAASLLASFVCISEARKERDIACRKQLLLQEQVEQMSCVIEAQKGGAR